MRPAPGRTLVFGAGGLGREMLQVLRDIAQAGQAAECVAFAVDAGLDAPDIVHGVPVRRDAGAMLRAEPTLSVVVALGNPARRAAVVARLMAEAGPRFATLLHPAAWFGQSVTIGAGCMVFGFTSATSDVRIGDHVLINPGCTLAHDVVLEDFATLAPSVALAGGVYLERGAEIGIGARVAPRLTIGRGAMVGAGAMVIRTVEAGVTVVGVPAHPLEGRSA